MDGLLLVEVDLNLCRQVKDKWGLRVSYIHVCTTIHPLIIMLQMTQRLDLYADSLRAAVHHDYKPDIVS